MLSRLSAMSSAAAGPSPALRSQCWIAGLSIAALLTSTGRLPAEPASKAVRAARTCLCTAPAEEAPPEYDANAAPPPQRAKVKLDQALQIYRQTPTWLFKDP